MHGNHLLAGNPVPPDIQLNQMYKRACLPLGFAIPAFVLLGFAIRNTLNFKQL